MIKIPTLFVRDPSTLLVTDELNQECAWVASGVGHPTIKIDGRPCRIDEHGTYYRRVDRQPTRRGMRAARRAAEHGKKWTWRERDYKAAPDKWQPAMPAPHPLTGHWPGWCPVGVPPREDDGPYGEAYTRLWHRRGVLPGTYELVGPAIRGNVYGLSQHELWRHSAPLYAGRIANDAWRPQTRGLLGSLLSLPPRQHDALRLWLEEHVCEGVVWHARDGRMAKLKRADYGIPWPPKTKGED